MQRVSQWSSFSEHIIPYLIACDHLQIQVAIQLYRFVLTIHH